MSKARLDLEKDKFDSEGRVKVSIESNNVGSFNGEVTVNNTSSEPVPVSIINPSDAIDLQVEIQPNITIDDSTPIDVNVTNSSVNTNATIQNASLDVNLTDLDVNNRLPVSVDNQPTVTIDDATPVDVNVTNTVATNATIQNSEIDVNVTNAFQYVYDMVYDGSQWRFQLSDTNGKAINLDRTYYTSSDITTMGASSDINVWLAAYNDSMLTKKYVATWDAEYEQDVYLQHPSLSSGNCLHLIYQYTTQNAVKVLESVWAKIDTWSYDDEISGTVSITAGTVTNPAVDAAAGTDVCTLTATNNSIGDIVVSLSGINASLYQLNDGVTTGSSITNPSTPLVIETANAFSGTSYSHSITATITSITFGVTDSVTIETSGTASDGVTWANNYYALGTSTSANIKLHADYDLSQSWTISFWVYAAAFSGSTHLDAFHPITSLFTSSHTDAIHASYYPAGIYVSERNNIQSGNPNYFGLTEPNSGSFVGYSTQFDRTYTSGWHNVIVTWDSTYYNASSISQANVKAGLTYYYDNVAVGKDTDSNASGSINPANFIFTGLQFGSHSAANHTNAYNGGRLDGVAIWTSHLVTSAERTHIYNNGTPQDLMNTTNLTSPTKYWLMEDDTDLAYDIKNSTSNEGSSTNFTRTAH